MLYGLLLQGDWVFRGPPEELCSGHFLYQHDHYVHHISTLASNSLVSFSVVKLIIMSVWLKKQETRLTVHIGFSYITRLLQEWWAAMAVRVLCSLCLCSLMLLCSGFCLYVHKMVATPPILICSRLEQHRKIFLQLFAFLFMKESFP